MRRIVLCLCCFFTSSLLYVAAQNNVPTATDTVAVGSSLKTKGYDKKTKSSQHIDPGSLTTDSAMCAMHSPTVAVCLSIIPGGGQLYNKKWWKVPIIYAGLGASGYFIYYYATRMNMYKKEYRNRVTGGTCDPTLSHYDNETVLSLKKSHQRSMEIAIAIGSAVYVLNMLDAFVDAHLFYFDISDKLSLQYLPYAPPTPYAPYGAGGISIALNF